MKAGKIDKIRLHQLLRQGKQQNEIAQLFGVVKMATSKVDAKVSMLSSSI